MRGIFTTFAADTAMNGTNRWSNGDALYWSKYIWVKTVIEYPVNLKSFTFYMLLLDMKYANKKHFTQLKNQ